MQGNRSGRSNPPTPMGEPDRASPQETIRRACAIAVRDLRACYGSEGIVAGRLHFNAYWARDGFWALFGALALHDYGQALAQLNTFIRYQGRAGCVPVRVEFVSHSRIGYDTLFRRPKVVGRAGGLFADPVDPTALFVIAASAYLDRTRDVAFARVFEPAMDRALAWLIRRDHDGDGLIEGGYLTDWMDSILKGNKLSNVNIIFSVALRAAEAVKLAVGSAEHAEGYRQMADRVHARIQEVFWNGRYFTDWVHGQRRGGFSTDGNLTAIFFGAATPEQSRRILEYIAARGLNDGAPIRTCDPVYPWWRVFPLYYFAGIPDYHRTLIWPWQGTLLAITKHRMGDRPGALEDLARIADWYVRENAVNEVYSRDGTPVARYFYHAEVPFAWNAGLFVHAVHEMGLAARSGTEPGREGGG